MTPERGTCPDCLPSSCPPVPYFPLRLPRYLSLASCTSPSPRHCSPRTSLLPWYVFLEAVRACRLSYASGRGRPRAALHRTMAIPLASRLTQSNRRRLRVLCLEPPVT